jgi:hypothetical protein
MDLISIQSFIPEDEHTPLFMPAYDLQYTNVYKASEKLESLSDGLSLSTASNTQTRVTPYMSPNLVGVNKNSLPFESVKSDGLRI